MVLPVKVWVSMARKLTASERTMADVTCTARGRGCGTAVAGSTVMNAAESLQSPLVASPLADPAAPPIVIVGSGPAGMRVAAGLTQLLPNVPRLVYGDEPCEPYDRARLSAFLAGELRWEALAIDTDLGADPALECRFGCSVTAIDRAGRNIVDSWGRVQPYSKLILATGARPHVPRIPGITLAGVFTFRDFRDAQRLMARRARTRRTVVLGGGLFGLQAARAMRRSRIEVIVVEHAASLMPQHTDAVAAGILKDQVERSGVRGGAQYRRALHLRRHARGRRAADERRGHRL